MEEKHFSSLWSLEVVDTEGLRVSPFHLKHITSDQSCDCPLVLHWEFPSNVIKGVVLL